MVAWATKHVISRVGWLRVQVTPPRRPLVVDQKCAEWVRKHVLGDMSVLCSMPNYRGAAPNVHLRAERKVELVLDLGVWLCISHIPLILGLQQRCRDRVCVVDQKDGHVSVSSASNHKAVCALQLELFSLRAVLPSSAGPELRLDTRRVDRTGGLVAKAAGAAVVV